MDNIVESLHIIQRVVMASDERNVTGEYVLSVIDIMQQVPLQDVMGVRASDVPAADWMIRQH
jgi:hypothetical protein